MESAINFLKKNKVYLLIFLIAFFATRSCKKGVEVNRLTKKLVESNLIQDSLTKFNLENKSMEYSKGFLDGVSFEKNEILSYINQSTKRPLEINCRTLFNNITDSISENKHQKNLRPASLLK